MQNNKQRKEKKTNKNWKIVNKTDFETALGASDIEEALSQIPERPSVREKKIIRNRKVKVKVKDKTFELTLAQKKFCEFYTSQGELFANGVRSYIEAYDIDITQPGAYTGAKSSAYQLLTNPHILDYINSLLEMGNLNDVFVDKQLEFLITQNAELGAKITAIREYNKLKSRVVNKLTIEAELNIKVEEEPSSDYAEYLKKKAKGEL